MKSIVLSIKPRFASEIYSHRKHIELRKRKPNVPDKTAVFMYETSPIKKVTGVFYYMGCIVMEKEEFWRRYGSLTCVTEGEFYEYYKNEDYVHGWMIGDVLKFETPNTLGIFDMKNAPQSYAIVYPAWP